MILSKGLILMSTAAERCIYCHSIIEFDESAELVRCKHCGQKIGVTEFSRFKKKVEAAETASLQAIRELQQAQQNIDAAAQMRLDAFQQAVESANGELSALRNAYFVSKNDEIQNLYELAESKQRIGEFDDAEKYYRDVQVHGGHDCEVHWRIVLCRYGVEYVYSADSGEYLPTIGHLRTESILEDPDYKAAVEYASSDELRSFYRARATQIDDILQQYTQIKQSNTYDVFISVKQVNGNGSHTVDSDKAIQLYHMLSSWGLKVFNSNVSLPNYAGEAYEPRIIAALMSAKVMIVVGTKADHIMSPWVRSEWRRFHWLAKQDPSRKLLIYLSRMSPKSLPNELSYLESIVEGPQSSEHLRRSLSEVFPKLRETHPAKETPVSPAEKFNVQAALNSVKVDLQYAQWSSAETQLKQIREHAPYNSTASLYALMAERKVCREEDLGELYEPLTDSIHFGRALEFASESEKERLLALNQHVLEHIEALANYVGSSEDTANQYQLTQREPDSFLHWWRYCICLTNNMTVSDNRAEAAYRKACDLAPKAMRKAMQARYAKFTAHLSADHEQNLAEAERRLNVLLNDKQQNAEAIQETRKQMSVKPVKDFNAEYKQSRKYAYPLALILSILILVIKQSQGYPIRSFFLTPKLFLRGICLGSLWPLPLGLIIDLIRMNSCRRIRGAFQRMGKGGQASRELPILCSEKNKSTRMLLLCIGLTVLYWAAQPTLSEAFNLAMYNVAFEIGELAIGVAFPSGNFWMLNENMLLCGCVVALTSVLWHRKAHALFDTFAKTCLNKQTSAAPSPKTLKERYKSLTQQGSQLDRQIEEARKQLKSLQKQ